jgi:sugar phosphate isomerase/epimerase
VRSDVHWPENLRAAQKTAALAAEFGLPLVSFHAGFLPEQRGDPLRSRLLDRLRSLVDVFAASGVRVAFETGQETAATLLDVFDELSRPLAGVNFDPANMLLYGMGDPLDALCGLLPRVLQVHVKDARPAETPGTWGRELPVGEGSVDWETFFGVLRRDGVPRDLMLEREAGDDRLSDVRAAAALVRRLHPLGGASR